MKLTIKNTSQYSDDIVEKCVRFAFASVVKLKTGRLHQPYTTHNVEDPRRIEVVVNNSARHSTSGYAYDGHRLKTIRLRVGAPSRFPVEPHRYWTYQSDEDFPLIGHVDYIEGVVGVAAHEFMHLHGDSGNRREREYRCEMAELEALEEFRAIRNEWESELAEARRKEADKETAKAQTREQRLAILTSPQFRLGKELEKKARWVRKAKLAATKLKQIERKIRRIEKQIAQAEAN